MIFVYGTLKRGEANARYMRRGKFVGEFETAEARFVMREFEYAHDGGRRVPLVFEAVGDEVGGRVQGEVYEVGQVHLRALDVFEGRYYRRREVKIEGFGELVWMYVAQPRLRPKVLLDVDCLDGVYGWSGLLREAS